MTSIWARPDRFFGWKALGAAAAMYFALTGLLLYSFPVFLPFLCKAFGWSRASVSWANSLALVVQGLASPLAGMPDGEYAVPDQGQFVVQAGRITTPAGVLAGSNLSLAQAAAHMIKYCNCTPEQALQLATLNPARVLGLSQTKGSLAPGKSADIVVLDSQWQIKMVIKEGQVRA